VGIDRADAWQLVLAFGIGAGLALAVTLWALLHQHRDRSHPVLRAWRAMARRVGRAGFAKGRDEPPMAWARRVAGARPEAADAMLSVSQRYSDWRYAQAKLTEEQQAELARQLRRFRIPSRSRP
jgi:hypothetical protein